MPRTSTLVRRLLAPEEDDAPRLPSYRELIREELERPAASPMDSYEQKAEGGLLYTLGRALDYPGRKLREAFTGRREATGRDVLAHMGLANRHNRPGLDFGDVAGFATEVVMDPLNLVGGVGAYTKAGKLAARAGTLSADAARLRSAARLATTAAERATVSQTRRATLQALRQTRNELRALGAPTRLAQGARAQALTDVPQRALLQLGLPFADPSLVVRGAPVLGVAGRALEATKITKAGQLLRQLFDPGSIKVGEAVVGRPQAARPFFEAFEESKRGAGLEAGELSTAIRGAAETAQAAEGRPLEEFLQSLRSTQESLGVPQRAGREAGQILSRAHREIAEFERRARQAYRARQVATSEQMLRRADEQYARYSARADELRQLVARTEPRASGLRSQAGEALSAAQREASEILVTPRRPIRQAEAASQKIFERFALWAENLLKKIGVGEQALKKAGAGAGNVDAQARALARLEALNKRAAAIRAKLPQAMSSAEREVLDAFESVLGRRAGQALRRGKSAAQILERGAYELERLKLDRRINRLLDRGLESLVRARQRAGETAARALPQSLSSRLAMRANRLTQRAQAEAGRLIARGREADRLLGSVRPETLRLAHGLSRGSQGILQEELQSGARAAESVFSSDVLSYAERVLTPEAKEWLRANNRESDFLSYLSRRRTTRAGNQVSRELPLAEELTAKADEWFQQNRPDLEGHWFEFDPAKSAPQRFLSGKISVAAAKLFHGLADTFGNQPHVPGQTVELAEFLTAGPLHSYKGNALSRDLAATRGILNEAGLGGRGIPRDIAAEATETMRKVSAPEEIATLAKAYDSVTGVMKTMLTVPFPAYHARNLLSDTILSWLGNGADPRLVGQAWRAIRDPQFLARMEREGVLKGGAVREVLQDIGAVDPSRRILDRLGQRFPRLAQAKDKAGKLTSLVENFTRTWHYLSRQAAGDTAQEAARSVRRWLLDYSELTPFEKSVMRRAFFFYQWPRKVLPKVLGGYLTQPRKMALLTRLTTQPTQERGPLPEFLRQTAAVPFGQNAQGEPQYLSGFGSPLEELNKLDFSSPEGGVLGGVGKLTRAAGNQLNPMLRYPIERATGRDLFFDREILTGDRAEAAYALPGLRDIAGVQEERLPSGETRYRGDPLALHLLRSLPTSRLVKEGGNLVNVLTGADERTPRLQDLLQLLTGIRLSSVDEVDRVRTLLDLNRREAQPLIREGKIGTFSDLYSRGREKDPEAVGIVERARDLKELLKKLRDQRQRS